jgi:nickel transport protein
MQISRSLFLLSILLVSMLHMSRGETHAHGVEYSSLESSSAIVVEFRYSSGEPLRFAEVTVCFPADTKVEYQSGRSDRNGRFAFLPKIQNEWFVNVDDGRGHALSTRLEVAGGTNLQVFYLQESGKQGKLPSGLLGGVLS